MILLPTSTIILILYRCRFNVFNFIPSYVLFTESISLGSDGIRQSSVNTFFFFSCCIDTSVTEPNIFFFRHSNQRQWQAHIFRPQRVNITNLLFLCGKRFSTNISVASASGFETEKTRTKNCHQIQQKFPTTKR